MDRVRDDVPGDQEPVIQIELWLEGSMPAGIATAAGAVREFTGWVGLMSAVEALATGEVERPANGAANSCVERRRHAD
jgi:hypothetical protein